MTVAIIRPEPNRKEIEVALRRYSWAHRFLVFPGILSVCTNEPDYFNSRDRTLRTCIARMDDPGRPSCAFPSHHSKGRRVHLLVQQTQEILFTEILFLSITLFLFGPPSTADLPTYDTIADAVKNPQLPNLQLPELPELPNLPQPFGPPTHDARAEQNSNSTGAYRLINYIQNYKWHNPFSKDVADENTTVLPPLMERPSIYTFFEPRKKQSKELAEPENRLILAWRRAWWAQGFKPQVLSRAEAMGHPQYEIVQRLIAGSASSYPRFLVKISTHALSRLRECAHSSTV
ncbi:hypothetical protein M011DRAFT_515541 [Sporormia fimetaria CBS 119925]|uniref:Uncharacterized protein n=1 Tax=Sporormia fimetaria CBS 119925 TaxID=1340428 RepID=A0A6A6UTH4_9PLEO|nr:hypothetical protein M011DRAFT_515541 [Sporormia fimetaria CBS 119925]